VCYPKEVRLASLALIVFAGCGSETARRPPPPPDAATAAEPPPPVAEPSPFPPSTLALRLRRTVGVRLQPFERAKRIGTIAIDTRVGWTRTSRGDGCSAPWVELKPRGWVCSEYLEPIQELPRGDELPRLERGEIVPGTYGKVAAQGATTMILQVPKAPPKSRGKAGARGAPVTSPSQVDGERPAPVGGLTPGKPVIGSVNVRQYRELVVAGRRYWKISPTENEYLPASAISQHKPSEFQGSRLGDDTGLGQPLAFLWPRGGAQMLWSRVTAKVGVKRQLPRRVVVTLLETATDPAGRAFAYRIGLDEWVDANAVRRFTPAAPPARLLPGERWIDIDLETQILVAYEGELPVYATLVSAGARLTPTETGVYRMWKKMAETDMDGLTGEDPYSVATVPWTQFFSPEKGLALHTAYWHDGFGTARSHGCVNLAPADARWLYFWSEPHVPPGWTMAAGVTEQPGSVVRVRSKADPEPPLRGYAKLVDELRSANAPSQ
jgi:L,D-transpeptidase catalytic domain